MKNKLLVLDIDGTLISHKDKRISNENKEALIKLQKSGCRLVLASGRLKQGMEKFAKELEMNKYNGYIITNNGAEIIDLKAGKTIYRSCLKTEYVKLLYKKSKELNTNLMLIQEDHIVMTGYDKAVEVDQAQLSCDFIWPYNIEKYLELDTFRCNFTKSPEALDNVEKELKNLYKDELEVARGLELFLDVTEKGVSKGNAVEYLANVLDIPSVNIVACGDADNDISMLKFVGTGVAMKSGSKDAIKASNIIAPNPEDNGIAWVVKTIFGI